MNQQLEKQSYAGVVCRSCRQAIPLPAIVISKASEIEKDPSGRENSAGLRVHASLPRMRQGIAVSRERHRGFRGHAAAAILVGPAQVRVRFGGRSLARCRRLNASSVVPPGLGKLFAA